MAEAPTEEAPAPGGEEVEKPRYGEDLKLGDPKWKHFYPAEGEVLEAYLRAGDGIPSEGRVAVLITAVKETSPGDIVHFGRFIGSDKEDLGKYASIHINRRELGLHICKEDPCPGVIDEVAGHVIRGTVWNAVDFDAEYMKLWGKMVLKEWKEHQTIKRRTKKPKVPPGAPEKEVKAPKRKPRAPGREKKAPREDGDGRGRGRQERDKGDAAGLKRKLDELRKRLEDRGGPEAVEVIDVEALPDEEEPWDDWSFAEDRMVSKLEVGDHLNSRVSRLALADAVKPEGTSDGCMKDERKKMKGRKIKKRKKRKLGTTSQLLEVAEERQRVKGCEREKKKGKKKKGSEGVRALVKMLGQGKSKKKSRPRSDKQWQFRGGQQRRGKQFLFLGDAGSTTKEKSSSPWSCSEDADKACPADLGPDIRGGSERGRQRHSRCQDGDILQPADPPLPCLEQPRYEGVALPEHLHRRAEKWEAGSLRGQPGFEVLGSAQRCKRRRMENGTALGVAPLRGGAECSHALAVAGQEALRAHRQEPGQRRAGQAMAARRLEERGLERAEGQRQGSKELFQRRKRKGPWQLWIQRKLVRMGTRRRRRQEQLVERQQRENRKGGSKGEERGEVKNAREEYKRGEEASQKNSMSRYEDAAEGRTEDFYERGEEASRPHEGLWVTEDEDEEALEKGNAGSRESRRGVALEDPLDFNWGRGFEFVARLAEVGKDLATFGCALAWVVLQAERCRGRSKREKAVWSLLAGMFAGQNAVRRPQRKRAFPIRLGKLRRLAEALGERKLEDAVETEFVREWKEDAWLFNCVQYCNYLGGSRAFQWGCWRETDLRVIANLKSAVARTLAQDCAVDRPVAEVEKELTSRFMSYTGEEIPKMEVLTIKQVEPSLPMVGPLELLSG